MKTTPAPWTARIDWGTMNFTIYSPKQDVIAYVPMSSPNAENNAALIYKAVNVYEEAK